MNAQANSLDATCLALLEVLYDEIDVQLANWVNFLDRLAELTDVRAAFVRSSNQQTGEGRALLGARLTASQLGSYEQLHHPAAVQLFRLKNPLFTEIGAVAPIDLTGADVARSPLGQALAQFDVGQLLNAVFDQDGPVVFSVTLLRQAAAPAFGEAEIALLQRLLPHLTRAARISRNLRYLTGVNAALARSLNSLPAGVLLTDARGRVLSKNRTAAAALRKPSGLRLGRDGALRAVSSDQQPALELLLRRAADVDPVHASPRAPAGTLALRRGSGRRPLHLLALAAGEAHTGLLTSERTVALFFTDPDRAALPDVWSLRGLWGLSPTEARVARLVAQGQPLPEIADALGVRPSTVRTHLDHIFDKTGARRQTELVGLLAWSVAALDLMQESTSARLGHGSSGALIRRDSS